MMNNTQTNLFQYWADLSSMRSSFACFFFILVLDICLLVATLPMAINASKAIAEVDRLLLQLVKRYACFY